MIIIKRFSICRSFVGKISYQKPNLAVCLISKHLTLYHPSDRGKKSLLDIEFDESFADFCFHNNYQQVICIKENSEIFIFLYNKSLTAEHPQVINENHLPFIHKISKICNSFGYKKAKKILSLNTKHNKLVFVVVNSGLFIIDTTNITDNKITKLEIQANFNEFHDMTIVKFDENKY